MTVIARSIHVPNTELRDKDYELGKNGRCCCFSEKKSHKSENQDNLNIKE